jgi:hypothetical protein
VRKNLLEGSKDLQEGVPSPRTFCEVSEKLAGRLAENFLGDISEKLLKKPWGLPQGFHSKSPGRLSKKP